MTIGDNIFELFRSALRDGSALMGVDRPARPVTYRVGIAQTHGTQRIVWLHGGFPSHAAAATWVDQNGCYRNVRIEIEPLVGEDRDDGAERT